MKLQILTEDTRCQRHFLPAWASIEGRSELLNKCEKLCVRRLFCLCLFHLVWSAGDPNTPNWSPTADDAIKPDGIEGLGSPFRM